MAGCGCLSSDAQGFLAAEMRAAECRAVTKRAGRVVEDAMRQLERLDALVPISVSDFLCLPLSPLAWH